jgi:uncharacterized lipoprotein NlpE involved in copper resistance
LVLVVAGACSDEAERPEPDPAPAALWGMYLYMADAAVFTECRSGKSYPVDLGTVGIDVERAYLEQRPGPGEPLLASLTGRFVLQSPEPGAPRLEHLRVVEFDRFWPGESCARAAQGRP